MSKTSRCAVVTCPNHFSANVNKSHAKLHKFPADDDLRKKWCLLLGIKYESLNPAYLQKVLVCQEHFAEFHSRSCQLLSSYESRANQNNCSRSCTILPKGTLPSRNLPSSIVADLAADASESAEDVKQLLIGQLSTASASNGSQQWLNSNSDGALPSSSGLQKAARTTRPRILKPAPKRPRCATSATAKIAVKLEPTEETFPVEVFNATRNQPMQIFVPEKQHEKANMTPRAIVPKPINRIKNPPKASPAVKQPSALQPKFIVPRVAPINMVVQARPIVVPLPGNLIADMMDGMASDPDANIELVWSENPFLSPVLTDVNSMCRMCAKSGVLLSKIADDDCDLAKLVNECLPFQICKNDGFSQMICFPCRRSVIRTHKFYLQCRAANAIQRNINSQINLSKAAQRKVESSPKPALLMKSAVPTPVTRPLPVPVRVQDIVPQNRDDAKIEAPSSSTTALRRVAEPCQGAAAKRFKITNYPKLKPETPVYSIYKFPDPKNLMRTPDYDCKLCTSSYCVVLTLAKHYWTNHKKNYCVDCNLFFEIRKDFECHYIDTHCKVPPIYNFHFDETNAKTCTFCYLDFDSIPELRRHYVVEGHCEALRDMMISREKQFHYKYTCDFCGLFLKKRNTLTKHILFHITEHQCKVCNKKFSRKAHLEEHAAIHTSELNAQCEDCGALFKTMRGLTQHREVHEGRWNNRCTCCSQTFRFIKDAEAHFKTHSRAEKALVEYKPYTKVHKLECPFCQRPFKWELYYKRHLTTHDSEAEFLCDQCGMNFKSRNALRYHKRKMHRSLITYECNDCGSRFKSKQGLKLHLEKHLNETKQCEECKQTFNGKTSLRIHQRTVHCDRDFECNYCSKKFKSKKQLVTHVRVHTDERPYQCTHCPRAFKQWGDRKNHEVLHHGKQ